jgi:hypothetical protein
MLFWASESNRNHAALCNLNRSMFCSHEQIQFFMCIRSNSTCDYKCCLSLINLKEGTS